MDEDLRQELQWINENLKAIMRNQTALYLSLQELEECRKPVSRERDDP